MKILFMIPNWKEHKIKHTNVTINAPRIIPLEYLYIASLLNDEIETKILDANLRDLPFDIVKNKIIKFCPDLIVLSSTINYLQWRCPPLDLSIPKKIVEFCNINRFKTMLIGPHGTVEPYEVMRNLHPTFIIRGEPEVVVAKFINSGLKDYSLKGIYVENNDTGISKEIEFKELKRPKYELINLSKYDCYTWSTTVGNFLLKNEIIGSVMELSRGCMYNCVFCLRSGFRENYRIKSLSTIYKEIRYLKDNNIGYIYFIDEIFNFETETLFKVLNLLKQEDILFGCQARPDRMTKTLMNKMYESGCIYIEYGVESYDTEILKRIHKNINIDYIHEIIAYSKEKLGENHVSIGFINFYSKDIMTILEIENRGKWFPKVIRPYPGSELGKKILNIYKIKIGKWEFILRYNWWLQIENYSNLFKDDKCNNIDIRNKILFAELEESYKVAEELIDDYIQLIKKLKRKMIMKKGCDS